MQGQDYWSLARPTYIENWPKEMCSLSIAQVDVPLTIEDAKVLASHIKELWECWPGKCNLRSISDIRNRLDEAIRRFPSGAFVRLGSRSPKDSWIAHREGMRVYNGEEALKRLMDCSERIHEDLVLAYHHAYAPHIFARQWIDIPKWTEFRCFMRNRKLVGISQYLYRQYFQEIEEHKDGIKWAIEMFFESFRAVSNLDDVIFDAFVQMKKHEESREMEWEAKLLEINPFFEMTDPCLFDHRSGGDFDGSFRTVENTDEGRQDPKRRAEQQANDSAS